MSHARLPFTIVESLHFVGCLVFDKQFALAVSLVILKLTFIHISV